MGRRLPAALKPQPMPESRQNRNEPRCKRLTYRVDKLGLQVGVVALLMRKIVEDASSTAEGGRLGTAVTPVPLQRHFPLESEMSLVIVGRYQAKRVRKYEQTLTGSCTYTAQHPLARYTRHQHLATSRRRFNVDRGQRCLQERVRSSHVDLELEKYELHLRVLDHEEL